jgi:hypothetical protein
MVKDHAPSVFQPKNLICNFCAPSLQQFQRWKAHVQWAKDNSMNVCHLTLSLTDSFMKDIAHSFFCLNFLNGSFISKNFKLRC